MKRDPGSEDREERAQECFAQEEMPYCALKTQLKSSSGGVKLGRKELKRRKQWARKAAEAPFPCLTLRPTPHPRTPVPVLWDQEQAVAQSAPMPPPGNRSLLTESLSNPFGAVACYSNCIPMASRYANFIFIWKDKI